jgi:selenocysteine-specific elongation factor
LKSLEAQGTIRADERGVALVGRGPRLTQNERKLLSQLVEVFRGAGIASPTVQECQQQAPRNQGSVPQLLALAAENGDLVAIAPDYYVHVDAERQTRDTLRKQLANGEGLTLSQIRELLGTTRKYAVPLCEYFDRIGFTRRQGDLRFLASRDES